MIKTGLVEKNTQKMINNGDVVAKRLLEASKKKWEEISSSDLFVDLKKSSTVLKVQHEVRLYREKYYIRLNFMSNNQILRYELTSSGNFTHANCFEQLSKGNRNMIPLGSNAMDAVLSLIYSEFPVPSDDMIYRIEKDRCVSAPKKEEVKW